MSKNRNNNWDCNTIDDAQYRLSRRSLVESPTVGRVGENWRKRFDRKKKVL
jgi:hypothetical protein